MLTALPPILEIGPSVYTAEVDLKYIIGSKTLAPGGPPLIVDNVPYALAPSATALIIGTQTIALSQPTAQLVATIKNIIYTAAPFHDLSLTLKLSPLMGLSLL